MPKSPKPSPTPFTRSIHAEINGWMKRRGFSQRQLATLAGLDQGTLSNVIGTNKRAIDTNELEAVCKALQVDPAELVRAAQRALQSSADPRTVQDPENDLDLAAKKREARRRDARDADYL